MAIIDDCNWTVAQLEEHREALTKFLVGQHLTNRQAALTLSVALLELASRSPSCLDTVERYLGLSLVSIGLARRGITFAQVEAMAADARPAPAPSPSQIIQALNMTGMTVDDAAEGLRQCAHALLKEKPASRPTLLKAMRDMLREFEAN